MLTACFSLTETPEFVKFSTRSSFPHGESQYKMYGIALSCVDVLVFCSFICPMPQVLKNVSFYRNSDRLDLK